MSNFAAQLKTEISRIAKKESRTQSAVLKKAQATHRAEIADLKRRIASLEAVVRRSDLVARVRCDEFVVALCALESADTARFVAAKIVSTLARPIELGDDGQLVTVGASVGVVYTSSPIDAAQKLLRRADDAMCDARRAGRSQFRFAPGGG